MLNRRTGGGVLWGLNAAGAALRHRKWRSVDGQVSCRRERRSYGGAREDTSHEATDSRSPETGPAKNSVRAKGNGQPSFRGGDREAHVRVSLASVHEVTHGGPRGSVPGRSDSMRTI